MDNKKQVGLAFQGGGFPAGAIGAGVVKRLVEAGAFKIYDIAVFSGTSAGALNASVCWGSKLKGAIEAAPEIVEKLWLHFALGLVPDAQVAQGLWLLDEVSSLNPLYQAYSDNMVVPFLRTLMKQWILTYLPVAELIQLRDEKLAKSEQIPGLALGAADVLRGEIKVFGEKDFGLEAILASGSLDEVNGLTEIKQGRNQGVYCDGAWGTNPPINNMIDYGVDQIWLVEAFPKERRQIPRTPAERKDRKDELWQNSLVEHELHTIN
jgi:NTE family protein